jgi:hypothetical protein
MEHCDRTLGQLSGGSGVRRHLLLYSEVAADADVIRAGLFASLDTKYIGRRQNDCTIHASTTTVHADPHDDLLIKVATGGTAIKCPPGPPSGRAQSQL